MSNPLRLSSVCTISDSVIKFSLGLEPILFSPYHSIYSVGFNFEGDLVSLKWQVIEISHTIRAAVLGCSYLSTIGL